jgi:hypothetical protein
MIRRFRRRRATETRPLALGIALASFLAFVGLVTFDVTGGWNHPAMQAAASSIDPARGGTSGSPAPADGPAAAPRSPVRAGFLVPGELLLESGMETPRGALFLDDAPVAFPSVLDSVAAGEHALRLVEEGRVLWETDVRI